MNIKNLVIGIAIMILTLFVVMYGISIFYPQPNYEDFCGKDYYKEPLTKPDVCPSVCTKLYEIQGKECILNECGSGCGADGYNTFDTLEKCQKAIDERFCHEDYEKVNKDYYKTIFLITLPLGILILLAGMFLFNLEAVGSGLMGGGVLSILYGVGGYWRYSAEILKFSLSLIGLVIVIFAAYKFNKTGSFIFKKKGKKK